MDNEEVALLQRQISQLREDLGAVQRDQMAVLSGMWHKLEALEKALRAATHEEATLPSAADPEKVAKLVKALRAPLGEEAEPSPAPPAEEEEAAAVAAKEISPAEGEAQPPPYPVAVSPVPVPAPSPLADEAKSGAFELQFGRVWLVRLGIGLLITGLVLLGNYAYQNWIRDLPAGVRLAALYLGSFLLSFGGAYVGRRENLRRFGEVLIAGGMAFFYWCTFAAHHVPRLRVVESPIVAAVLLLLAACGIVFVSLRRDSKATAVMGLLLASYSTVLQPLGWLSSASNLMLAGVGTALLLRPRWTMPGIAAMAATYGAFAWWQIAGAIGDRAQDPAALWFLPPVWAMFALPGIFGVSRHFPGLSERARSGFATANNAAFFLLFSLVWHDIKGHADYWLVTGIFGAALIALGIFARRRDQAGGFHLAQGMAAVTAALVLKLDGFHLALALAGQSLGLALAFARFRGKSELAFSALAATGATALVLHAQVVGTDLPTWSCGLAALLLVAAAFPLRRGCDGFESKSELWNVARAATSLVFFAGCVVALSGWCLHLHDFWRASAAAAIGLGMTAFTLLKDPTRRLEEAAFAALAFHGVALGFTLSAGNDAVWWPPLLAGLLGLGSHGLWVRKSLPAAQTGFDLSKYPEPFLWVTALAMTLALYRVEHLLNPSPLQAILGASAAALCLGAFGRFVMRSPVLMIASALLLPRAVIAQLEPSAFSWSIEFLPLLGSLGTIAIALLPPGREEYRGATVIARFCAFATWLAAWIELAPKEAGDIFAASGAALLLASLRFRRGLPETWALLALGLFWWAANSADKPWTITDPAPFPYGWLTILACFTTGFLLKGRKPKLAPTAIFLTASGLLAAWATQLTVWHFDWKPVAVLWTGLGFLLVSAGLWQKIAAFRHAGFALLGMALGKLFVFDVWDFTTFTRVAAFLALGVALVVLGFFYNRFADVLKKLFEGDGA